MGKKKTDSKEALILYIILLVMICGVFTGVMYKRHGIISLKRQSQLMAYEVVDKYCASYRSGSYVKVNYMKGAQMIHIGEKYCNSIRIGDTIELYSSPQNDFLFRPDQDEQYKRIAYVTGVSLLLMLLPLLKLRKSQR
ncbi:MAG: hypothetical protein Roseis2KO_19610 [Roseivirga sp.]